MAAPKIRQLPEAPQRSDPPDEFSDKADAWVDELDGWTEEANELGEYVESRANDAETAADNASTSESNAADSADAADTDEQDAEGWAIHPEDSEFTDSDGTTGYSAKHHASKAATSASNASTSEDNAAQSESSASESADAAATSESNAADSADAAATSESNASTYEADAKSHRDAAKDASEAVAGTGMAATLIFDGGTSDEDPGDGRVRLNASTHSEADRLFVDDLDFDDNDISDMIAATGESTNPVKGHVSLRHRSDRSKWMIFRVTSYIDESGYSKLEVTPTDYTQDTPFSNGDILVMGFVQAGDKGLAGDTTIRLDGSSIGSQPALNLSDDFTAEDDSSNNEVDIGLSSTISEHPGKTDNPHDVTAEQVGALTKSEVESQAITMAIIFG